MSYFVTVQSRGTIALPPELRRKYLMDTPGAQVELTEREDGVIELRPTIAVPASQAWFWTEGHQTAEREVDDYLASGGPRRVFDNVDDFLDHLDSLDEQ